jgi:pimeloyl-ACP methyl ester carboxylesterase
MRSPLLLLSLLSLLIVLPPALAAQIAVPVAVTQDPVPDASRPASFTEITVPSHGEQMFGVLYSAAGDRPHPTVLLLHGFPGYEQNLDLAQAIRRAGWSVLAVHYRGSWGVHGSFSLAHAMEDSDAMVAFLRDPAVDRKYAIDPHRIVIVGHSMGGYLAASAAAHNPDVLGAVMIGTWDITAPVRTFGPKDRVAAIAALDAQRMADPADFLPLSGYTLHDLTAEIYDHRSSWDLVHFAPSLASRPLLLLTADDGSGPGTTRLAQALHSAGDTRVQTVYTPTDHSFSGRRIYLQSLVVGWLQHLSGPPPPSSK